MLVSNLFKQEILAQAFKGFYQDENFHLVPEKSISSDEMNYLKTIGRDIFGIQDKEEIERIVNIVLNEQENGKNSKNELGLVELPCGTSVCLTFSENKLKLLYLGNFRFIVVNDLAKVLLTGDILTSLDYQFNIWEKTSFIVYRDGKPHPCESKLYRTDPLAFIEITTNELFYENKNNKQAFNNIILPPDTVYAWFSKGMSGNFFEDQLTENSDALYLINIENATYSVNPDYNRLCYDPDEVREDLHRACEIVSEGTYRIITLQKGIIELNINQEGNYFFKIRQKAKVKL